MYRVWFWFWEWTDLGESIGCVGISPATVFPRLWLRVVQVSVLQLLHSRKPLFEPPDLPSNPKNVRSCSIFNRLKILPHHQKRPIICSLNPFFLWLPIAKPSQSHISHLDSMDQNGAKDPGSWQMLPKILWEATILWPYHGNIMGISWKWCIKARIIG